MLRSARRRPSVSRLPKSDSTTAGSAIQSEVAKNRADSANLWEQTDRDIAIANIAGESERVRQSRRQILLALIICFILLVVGLIYGNRTADHDRLLAQEREAAAEKPYAPQSIAPSQ